MPPPTQAPAPLRESRVCLGAALVCVHVCVGAEDLASSWVRTAGCSGYGRGPQPLRREGAQSRPCPPRRRSRVSMSHLSDRYKAESSRMNLGGNGAEKGREPLQAAAPKELAGVGLAHRDGQRGHQQGVPSPQEKTSAGSSLASVFLSVQWGDWAWSLVPQAQTTGTRGNRAAFLFLQKLPASPPHLGLIAALGGKCPVFPLQPALFF